MRETIISVFILILILVALGFLLMSLYRFARKRGGNFQHVFFGATQDFLTQDQNKAIEVIVNKKARQKEEEQESGEKL